MMAGAGLPTAERSRKSFTTAVTLCAIFGTVGLHHFYLGNLLHGLFDFGLLAVSVVLWIVSAAYDAPALFGLALTLVLVDVLHTMFVFYRLITGQQRDGAGRLVTFPGQA